MTGPPVTFTVVGTPAAQGSKRGFVNKATGRVAMVESSKRVKPWRQDVKTAALQAREDCAHETYTGPVYVCISFRLARPKSHYRTGKFAHLLRDDAPAYVAAKPDLDKLERSTYDALTEAGVFKDDSQIAAAFNDKRYCDRSDLPGARISVVELS